MKTKLSKRILSVFLAVLMMVTSVPLAAFTAFAENSGTVVTDGYIDAAREQMTAFEEKLETPNASYKKVTNAYNAYVGCQEALDAYIYGGVSSSVIEQATNNLKTAIAGIEDYTGDAAINAVNEKDNTTYRKVWSGDTVDANLYKNVLWSETNYNAERGSANGVNTSNESAPNVKTILYYPEVTLLYDGKNIPQATMRVTATGDGSANNKTRYVTAIELNNTDGIILDDNWKGFDGGNFDVSWALTSSDAADRISYTSTQNGAKVYEVYYKRLMGSTLRITPRNVSNIYKFTGTMNSSELYRDITPSVSAAYGSSGGFIPVGGDITSTVTGSQKIHVVNFKALIDAVVANGSKMKSIDITNYSQGGLSYYIKAMDDATAFNPLDYFTTSNNYTGCATEIGRLISVMENADTTKTNDVAYDNLRKAMDAKMGDYNKGVQPEDSTDASWAELKSAYEAAMAIMSGLTETGYNDAAAAQAAADKLLDCNLEFDVEKINTTELESVIDALFAYESIFVPELRAQANAAAAEAQIAVWGSVDNYPNTKDSLNDTPENQEIYANALESVKTAVRNLRFSPDKATMTSQGRYSLNTAIALIDSVENPTDYNNFADLTLAVEQARAYAATLNDVELTDYSTQMENHRAFIENVVYAYNNLEYSFTKIPDGTVAKVGGRTEMTPLTTHDTYNFQGQFSYTNSAVIIRTTHDAISVPWGRATVGVSSDCTNTNSGLDSVTINATMPKLGGQGGSNRIVADNNNSSTPKALSDQQKADYTGCLTNGNFEFKNIKYSGRTHNNAAAQAFVASDGTKVSAADAENIIIDEMLTKTDGTATNPANGVVTVSPNSKETAWAYVTGDLVINGPQFDKPTLGVATTPVKRTYTLNSNFGMVGLFNTQNGLLNYSYYQWLTSESTGEKININVEVVDISTLVDLVAECNLITEPSKYTEDSYNRFTTALKEAGSDIDYTELSADRIVEICESRYTNLWSAYNALKLKTYVVQFKYMDANGVEKTTTITPTHGDAISSKPVYLNNFNKINLVDYVDGNYTMQVIGWSPALDIDAPITSDITYVAQYEPVLNAADFTAFNAAKNAFVSALVDNKFTASSLKAASAEIAKLVYFDETAQIDVMADKQPEIDAETVVLEAQLAALKAVDYDKSVADAVKEQIALAQKTDPDMYEGNITLDNEEVVSICGKDVVGLVFEAQADLDKAIADAVNAMTPKVYDIYLNGVKIGTGVYGEAVVINSDGVLYNNVDDHDTDSLDGEGWAAWNYHYKANTSQSVDKYMFTAKAIGFVVRGDAHVTSTPADAPDSNCLVTIKDANSDKVLLAEVSSGEYTLPTAPARPYYNFVKYVVDGTDYKVGDVITVTANTTVEAVYTAKEENTFDILFYDGYKNCMSAKLDNNQSVYGAKYDDVVTFTSENAYCWADSRVSPDGDANYFTVLHYGPTYSFNVYKSMADTDDYFGGLVALSQDDYNNLQRKDQADVLETPDGVKIDPIQGDEYTEYVYSEAKPFVAAHTVLVPKYSESNVTKFTLIGFTAAPAGYTVVEHGFLFTKNADVTSMTVEDVDMKNVVRMKASNTTVGDQFVVDVKNPASSVSFKYSAYAVIKDAEGNTSYIYSNIIDGTNNF